MSFPNQSKYKKKMYSTYGTIKSFICVIYDGTPYGLQQIQTYFDCYKTSIIEGIIESKCHVYFLRVDF